jgi:hypothetical protein
MINVKLQITTSLVVVEANRILKLLYPKAYLYELSITILISINRLRPRAALKNIYVNYNQMFILINQIIKIQSL